MNPLLNYLHRRWGIRPPVVGLFAAALVMLVLALWLRGTTIRFNITVFYIAGGVFVINVVFAALFARREEFLGYIFAGAALVVQLLVLVLLWQAAQGVLL